jgi:hypothetical protein
MQQGQFVYGRTCIGGGSAFSDIARYVMASDMSESACMHLGNPYLDKYLFIIALLSRCSGVRRFAPGDHSTTRQHAVCQKILKLRENGHLTDFNAAAPSNGRASTRAFDAKYE